MNRRLKPCREFRRGRGRTNNNKWLQICSCGFRRREHPTKRMQEIADARRETGFSLTTLAKIMGIPRGTLSPIATEGAACSAHTWWAIVDGLETARREARRARGA